MPKGGIRQGDPLPPIFSFYVLRHFLLFSLVQREEVGSMAITCVGGLLLFLTFYLHMTIFFLFRVIIEEWHAIKQILTTSEEALSQAINFLKSGIFFSANVLKLSRILINNLLDVHTYLHHNRYMGLPLLVRKNEKEVFYFLKEHLVSRIYNWKNHFSLRC